MSISLRIVVGCDNHGEWQKNASHNESKYLSFNIQMFSERTQNVINNLNIAMIAGEASWLNTAVPIYCLRLRFSRLSLSLALMP